jgi:hypothetical protein
MRRSRMAMEVFAGETAPEALRLEMRQVFMAGPDDEQVEAPTFLGGIRYA